MGRNKWLLTQGEAIYWAGVDKTFSPCNIEDVQAVIFEDICSCFGEAFYDYLMEHLIDYSDVKAFKNTDAYKLGDVVSYKGILWQATQDTVAGNFPVGNNPCWRLADKFGLPCLNDFWCNASFARYLSYLVIRDSIVSSTIHLTNSGAVYKQGDGYRTPDDKSIRILQSDYSKKAQRLFMILEKWISQSSSNCFDCTKQKAISCCGGCGCVKEKCRCDDCETSKTQQFKFWVY